MRATLLNTGALDGRAVAVEWARLGARATAVVPGPRTTDDELGALVAFLASAGGECFGGCRFSLR